MTPIMSLHPVSAAAAALLLAACGGQPDGTGLTDRDSAALRAVERAYVEAWLADDTAAVLATLAPDAVIMPPRTRPLTTRDEIRSFWWPNDGSRTRVTHYATTIDEIGGVANMAYMRGTGELSFVYEKDTLRMEQTSRSNVLTVLDRGADGRWRIHRRMWGPTAP